MVQEEGSALLEQIPETIVTNVPEQHFHFLGDADDELDGHSRSLVGREFPLLSFF